MAAKKPGLYVLPFSCSVNPAFSFWICFFLFLICLFVLSKKIRLISVMVVIHGEGNHEPNCPMRPFWICFRA
ncbi:hypothetical protein TRIP_B330209 [uncultured Desulfatiglans sp.]|nr:hypothetical protein TRIP_B330209 [uncultured Desulfatiglans sp.]